MATASLLPHHYPALFTGHSRSSIKAKFPASFDVRRKPNPRFSPSSTISPASSSWDHEEKRWLREEQRWRREEQRWLRQEIRWSSEREALLLEIASLRLRVKALEGDRSPIAASVEAVLIAENEKVPEGVRIPEVEKEALKEMKERKTLRMGSEGESVREMQNSSNGAPVSSVGKFKETKEAVIKEVDDAQAEMSGHRVYLLGENRWEEPSRLRLAKSIESGAAKPTRCLTCRGEGKVLCTECDGSGEPNVEPQFLEWIGKGAKCPYCEGLGYIICDVCN